MSRVGGPNEVAALSVGITIDPSGLDAGLAAAKAKLDTFNQQNQINVHGPGIGPYGGDRLPGQNGGMSSPGPNIGPSIVGPGMENVGRQVDAIKPKLVEVERSGKSAFDGIGKSLREVAEPFRAFYLGVQQISSALFGIVGIATTAAAALVSIANIGKYAGDQFFETARKMRELKNELLDFSRVFDLQQDTLNKRMDMRLAQAGVIPQAREAILSERQGAYSKVKAAEAEVSEAESAPWTWGDIGWAALWGSYSEVGLIESPRKKRQTLARQQLESSNMQLDAVNKRISDITEGAPRGGFGNGTGGAVIEMSASNNRMDRREEAMNRKAVEEAMVEANRRR